MKAPFKPLSLAIAVATASAGYAGIVNAQVLADNTGLGDLAIIPYYTVNTGLSTGVSVINSSDRTQVVKIRLRRAPDSMDALDFNVVMSPQDVWTGYIEKAPEGEDIRFYSNDASCTVPELGVTGYFTMPNIYRLGADEGYIEVMGMGSPISEAQPIAVDAKHNDVTGRPKDCTRVSDNFRKGDTPTDYNVNPPASGRTRGVINSTTSLQWTTATNETPRTNSFNDTGNVLKVSYFIKSDATGNEFGGDAVHIANFMNGATITNQTVGINEGDLQGFDHPDLNGGAPTSVILGVAGAAQRGAYNPLRVALGATSVINDWSANRSDLFTVDTDWVITTPGQYLMTNIAAYIDTLEIQGEECLNGVPGTWLSTDTDNCDYRDIPLTVAATVYDREERGIEVEEDDLVVSPQPPGEPQIVAFDRESNVVQWGILGVLGSIRNVIIPTPDTAEAGWAQVSVTPDSDKTQAICDFDTFGTIPMDVTCTSTSTPVPLVGFVAWQRNFDDMPEANYGRIVDHSYTSN